MTNNNYTELSHSDDCEKYVNQFIQEFPLRSAEIGQGTVIKRALPSRHKRMIGACWPTSTYWFANLYMDDRRYHDAYRQFGQQTVDSSKTGQPHDRRTWNFPYGSRTRYRN